MRKSSKQSVFKKFFIAHINIYIFLLLLFFIGLIVGSVQSAFLGENERADSYNYVVTLLDAFKTKQIDINILFREFLSANLKPALWLWLFGLWIIGIPLICTYIVFEGYSLGFSISIVLKSLGNAKGSMFIGIALIPQELILIPVFITLGVNSILFANAIWQRKSRTSSIKFDVYRYVFLFILCVAVLIGVTVVETYVGVPLIKKIVNNW